MNEDNNESDNNDDNDNDRLIADATKRSAAHENEEAVSIDEEHLRLRSYRRPCRRRCRQTLHLPVHGRMNSMVKQLACNTQWHGLGN